MRLSEWPRMPFLNDEVREWIGLEMKNLGVEDLAVYVLEAGREGDERRIVVATEVGLLDHRYAPFGSSARYRLAMLLYPWQVLRGVELRADTFRLWAMEHRTRWTFKLHHPHFEAATESPELGQALCELARVCAVMAEPFGVPAGRTGHAEPSPMTVEPKRQAATRAPTDEATASEAAASEKAASTDEAPADAKAEVAADATEEVSSEAATGDDQEPVAEAQPEGPEEERQEATAEAGDKP